MSSANFFRRMMAAGIAVAAVAAGAVSANDLQPFGRSSVYTSARTTTVPKPFDGVTVAGNGRSSVYAVGTRSARTKTNFAAPTRTAPGNGRGSVYAWSNREARS